MSKGVFLRDAAPFSTPLANFKANNSVFITVEPGLVKQLDMLRTINTQLQDQSDLQSYGTGRSADETGDIESLADELNPTQPLPVEPALSEDSMEWDEPPIESQV